MTVDAHVVDGPSHPGRWNRATTPLVVAQVGASTAAVALVTVLGKQVFDITGRELDLGLLGLAEFAPALLLILVTGSVADRFNRRRIAAASLVGQAATALALFAYVAGSPTSAGPIFAIVVAFGVCRAFAGPAMRSLPADAVPGHQLSWLIARTSISFQLALIAGPVIGGSLYAIQPEVPYLAVVALLAGAAGAMGIMRLPDQALVSERIPETASTEPLTPRDHLHDALAGLRFIRHQPILLGAISLDLFAVLFGGAVALLPAVAEERLGVGAVGFGWLRAAGGIGAGIVTLYLARRPVSRRVGRKLLITVALFGVGTIGLGLTRSYVVAFAAMIVLSGADALSVVIRATLVPLVTPTDKRGRVLAVEMVFIGASNELGAFESGLAGQFLGPGLAIVLGGAATLAIAAGWWVVFPALRKVDRFPSRALAVDPDP